MKFGMLQGSSMGPLLVYIYTNVLSSVTINVLNSFVDDTKLYLALPLKELNDGLIKLNGALNKVAEWCSINQLLITPDNIYFILLVFNQLALQRCPYCASVAVLELSLLLLERYPKHRRARNGYFRPTKMSALERHPNYRGVCIGKQLLSERSPY